MQAVASSLLACISTQTSIWQNIVCCVMHAQCSFAVASYVYVTFCVHVAVCIVTWLMCFILAKKADSHTVAYHLEMVVASTVGGLLACTLAHALRLKALFPWAALSLNMLHCVSPSQVHWLLRLTCSTPGLAEPDCSLLNKVGGSSSSDLP